MGHGMGKGPEVQWEHSAYNKWEEGQFGSGLLG